MAKCFISSTCLMLILSCVESCSLPRSLYVIVPETIPPEYQVAKVETVGCDAKSTLLTVKDPSFTINSNGAVVALTSVSVAERGRTFFVCAQDNSRPESKMKVHLVRSTMPTKHQRGQGFLIRSKRRWAPPNLTVVENYVGPYPKLIERLVSDTSAKYKLFYTVEGEGFDKYPTGVFNLNRDTGDLFLLKAVDREAFPVYSFVVRSWDTVTNKETDENLPLKVVVDDVNDNPPEFVGPLQFMVPEHCSVGTVVGKVNTTDKDQIGTDHVKIRYTLLTGTDMFAIHAETGVITTKTNTLDRELKDNHLVVVQIQDMNGAPSGLVATSTATIGLSDINDNPPTFMKTSYDVAVQENESEKLLLRIPVQDKDLINTPNWISKFVITQGNENGNFRIVTDPQTNEGLLYVSKPLDYEKMNSVQLQITAQNQAPLSGSSASWNSIPVKVSVTDVDEGPEFSAPSIRFNVKENTPNGTVIGTYTATDPETKSSKGIKYFKITDPGSWINVDRDTGELRVANTIDRESPLVHDGFYNITVRAVDASSKSATGTVVIWVEDENDNIPTIPSELTFCQEDGVLGSVVVVAEDKDQSPFSSPFTFSLPNNNDGTWSVKSLNDTAATLEQLKPLYLGMHTVDLTVTDLQGSGKTQTVNLRVCKCKNGVCPGKDRSVSLGPLGILTMLLPVALLLLLFLLLAFFCLTKREKLQLDDSTDTGGILLKSNTEAPGDEVDASLINGPPFEIDQAVKGSVKGVMMNPSWIGNKSGSTIGTLGVHENGMHGRTDISAANMQDYYTGQYDMTIDRQSYGQLVGSGVDFDYRQHNMDPALLYNWETNGRYLHQKLIQMGTVEDGRYADDIIHSYGFEGRGSVAGSVGCCSDNNDNDNLDFLNTLGPKFKTLAEVCRKT
uniref:Cadherin domain-containing protein n=1 Tax=Astatotilapia calliptera TaxID=8154 RepID=A0A3P8QQZ5_ASTCA